MPPNIIIPGHTQIDDLTDPRYFADRVPGFRASMDGIKDARENYVELSDGIDHTLSLPYPIWLLLVNCFPDPKELHELILPRIAKLHPEYRVKT